MIANLELLHSSSSQTWDVFWFNALILLEDFFLISYRIVPNLESNSREKVAQIGIFV